MFHITARNPKGLDFDYQIEEPKQAARILENIHLAGGEEVRVNGNLIHIPA